MFVRACFPFFDTRFAREDAAVDLRPAPRWLYGEPPPPADYVGRLGKVAKWIPPQPYARCSAADLIKVERGDDDQFALRVDGIEIVADQHGHARLAVTLDAQTAAGGQAQLGELIEMVSTADVSVRHPDRRGVYDTLGAAAEVLCDLYARESARTAPEPRGGYQPDWVHPGRPFLVLVNTRREPVDLPMTLDMPAPDPGFGGRIHFFPWRAPDGDTALPVWYIDAPRGGDVWRQPAEAIEDLTAHYEELFLCAMLEEQAGDDPAYAGFLERHRKRLAGSLRRERRHGVDLQAALRLLSDYDRSVLKPRESDSLEATLIARINAQVGDSILRRNIVVNITGDNNLVNLGVMSNNTITMTNKAIDEAKAPDELKTQLKALRDPPLEAAKELPEAQAKALLKDYESFTEAALRESPPKEVVKAQGKNLIDTVKGFAAFATPVATIVGAILKIVAG